MKRIRILRDVTKDGRYERHYGVRRIDWYVDLPVPYRAVCISIGTRDIIICYRKKYRMLKGGTIEKRTHRQQRRLIFSSVYLTNQACRKYGGRCPKDNRCPGLVNPRGGDFGWGECIWSSD